MQRPHSKHRSDASYMELCCIYIRIGRQLFFDILAVDHPQISRSSVQKIFLKILEFRAWIEHNPLIINDLLVPSKTWDKRGTSMGQSRTGITVNRLIPSLCSGHVDFLYRLDIDDSWRGQELSKIGFRECPNGSDNHFCV